MGFVERSGRRPGKPLSNAAAWLAGGTVAHVVRKSLLPTYDVFDEDRYFEPASETAVIPWDDRKIGLTICEDIWNDADFWPDRLYRRDPVRELRTAGAEIILNLSASPWHLGKESLRISMLQRLARDERVPVIQVNLVGGNDELVFDGQSVAFDAAGKLLSVGPAFKEGAWIVDLGVKGDIERPLPKPEPEEQLYHALALGIRDYVSKCGFKSVALGLSGGIDSALVAVLAAEALGPGNVHGFSMPARYSSAGSLSDAEALARNLGIAYAVVRSRSRSRRWRRSWGRSSPGRRRTPPRRTSSPRLRGLVLMAVSNKFGHLVLTTGNKSEAAVGYCTLYGDMCGALAPISDLTKTQVYKLARWDQRTGEIIPPAASITKPPSAELRPGQTDQDSLPEYDLLDKILEAYVVEHRSRAELVAAGSTPPSSPTS